MKSSGHGAVIDPLLTLEREDLTGTLEFRARGVTTAIFFRSGEIVSAEGGTLGETLGRLLVRHRRLTDDHFGAIIRRLTDAVVDDTKAQLGDIAVQYGFLTRDELDVALMQQVKEKVIGCIHRGPGDWRFLADDPRVSEAGARVVRTRPTLVEASASFSERLVEDVLQLDAHRYPELVAPAAVVADEFELTREESAVLADLNGTSSFHFLLPIAPSPKVPALIAALVMGGAVVLRDAPAAAPRPAGARPVPPDFVTRRRAGPRKPEEGVALPRLHNDPMPILGSISDAGSYSTLLAARPRDQRSSRESVTALDAEAEGRARTAFARLSEDLEARRPINDRRRWPEPTSEGQRRLMAEAAFHRGYVFLRSEAAGRALPGLHRALELCSDEPEYELFVKWAQMLLNDAFDDADRRAEIEALAALVARRDHFCALAFAVLGRCAIAHGKEEAALRFLQRARHLDPQLVDVTVLDELFASTDPGKGPVPSRPDLRSRARGDLETPLDEIVPIAQPRAPLPPRAHESTEESTDPVGAPPDSEPRGSVDRRTPFGGLQVAPFVGDVAMGGPEAPLAAAATTAPSSKGSLFPASRMSSLPPPAPVAAEGARTAPMPSAPPLPVVAPPPASQRRLDPALPGDGGAPRRAGRRIALVAAWLASLGVTAGLFYTMGGRDVQPGPDAAPFAETTRASAVLEAEAAAAAAPIPMPSSSAEPAPPPSASAADARASTTTILRTPKAWGRRVFFDGHSLGDGGRDLTVPCGAHRVKVGSAGAERTVTLPCGGTFTVD